MSLEEIEQLNQEMIAESRDWSMSETAQDAGHTEELQRTTLNCYRVGYIVYALVPQENDDAIRSHSGEFVQNVVAESKEEAWKILQERHGKGVELHLNYCRDVAPDCLTKSDGIVSDHWSENGESVDNLRARGEGEVATEPVPTAVSTSGATERTGSADSGSGTNPIAHDSQEPASDSTSDANPESQSGATPAEGN